MHDRFIRASAAATVVAIGAIAAFISYRHAYGVAIAHGETGTTGRLLPLTIDGLVFVASLVLLDAARRRVSAPVLARVALALGIGATVAVNVLHGIAHGPIGAIIAAWPAVTLVVVVELLMGMIRLGRAEAAPRALTWWPPFPTVPVAAPAGVVANGRDRQGPLVNGDVSEPAEDDGPADPEVIATARDRFAEVLAAGAVPSVRAVRREMRVGYPRAVAIREALAEGA
ncbi:DUF2637 domain-containing protein [Actinomadura rugatobispora]|uniref:DUF2637 domain-containing protein n=1 Tax=Actinomadura rugatobispora TaxID=1994 RepID=A0ABW1A6W4_9ACTN|nr:hypothetical protein GCM10010200_028950 [Actinomadura rugatobispora]